MFIKSDNCTCLFVVDSVVTTAIKKPSIHSRHSRHTVILRESIDYFGMFMEERKIAL